MFLYFNKICILRKKIFFLLPFITFQQDICIRLLGIFSANYTWNAWPLVKTDDSSKPLTFSGPGMVGDAAMWEWPFQFKSNAPCEGNAGFIFQFLFTCSLPPAETKSQSSLSAFRLEPELDTKPCLWVTFFLSHTVISDYYFCCWNKTLSSIFQHGTWITNLPTETWLTLSHSSRAAANQRLGLTWLNKELNCKPWSESIFL